MSERMNKYCAAFLLLLSGGGNAAQAQTAYSVSGRIEDPSMEGRKIYLSIYDHDGRDIDSATVHNQSFRMEGVADAPYFVRLEPSDRKSYANFVLEDSVVIDYQAHKPSSGGKLTQKYLSFLQEMDSLNSSTDLWRKNYEAQHPDATEAQHTQDFYKRFYNFYEKWTKQESTNGVGECVWRDAYIHFLPYRTNGTLTDAPCVAQPLPRFPEIHPNSRRRETCQMGKHVTRKTVHRHRRHHDGRQSDTPLPIHRKRPFCFGRFLGQLVRAMPERIKRVSKTVMGKIQGREHADHRGDSRQGRTGKKRKKALVEENYSWPQILDAGTSPLEQYAITGIPHIMLLAPDGTILARNLRGMQIEKTIQEHINKNTQ